MSRTRLHLTVGLAALALGLSGCTPAAPGPAESPAGVTSPPAPTLAGRAVHTATPLADGSVLVAGGCDLDGCGRATASTFLLTTAGAQPAAPLTGPRDGHTATRLADGRVLVLGGYTGENQPPLATTEILDPATGQWRPTGPLRLGRGGHATAVLGDGRVLVTGGWLGRGTRTARTEVFDPGTAAFTAGPELPAAVDGHAAITLPDGSVLVAGGQVRPGVASAAAAVVDPRGDLRRVGLLEQGRFKHTMVPWADGTVLVVGGTSDDRVRLDSTEIYNPRTETFRPGPRLAYGRYKLEGSAVALPDGRVVVAGGGPGAELLDPRRAAAVPVENVAGGVASFGTVSLVGEELWLVGGYDERIDLTGRDVRIPLADL